MYAIKQFTDTMQSEVATFILGILENEFNHRNIDRPDLKAISKTYQVNNGNFWVAKDEDRLIGTVALRDYGNGMGHLKRMCVDAAYRGKGVAQDLLATLLSFAKTKGFKEIYLDTSDNMVAAQRFYEKSGFTKVDGLPDDFPNAGSTIFYKMTFDS